jgi:hypothetical protein
MSRIVHHETSVSVVDRLLFFYFEPSHASRSYPKYRVELEIGFCCSKRACPTAALSQYLGHPVCSVYFLPHPHP